MIHLRLRTEYSFRSAFGRPEDVLEVLGSPEAAGIGDSGTWGHVDWFKTLTGRGIKPLLGVEVACVPSPRERAKQRGAMVALIARTGAGLTELYELMTWANNEGFYYVPRISYDMLNETSDDLLVLSGMGADLDRLDSRENVWLELNPLSRSWNRKVDGLRKKWQVVVCGNNLYTRPRDKEAYEILAGRSKRERVSGGHIRGRDELGLAIPEATEVDFTTTHDIAGLVELSELPMASMVSIEWPKTLEQLCREGIRKRGWSKKGKRPWPPEYEARMMRELEMISSKGFEDYFQVITDMVVAAKEIMMVGPARGSAAGSLVCFLLSITDVDPILHDLMFERFIDVTRSDLPDVDIDFPDRTREAVVDHLKAQWGENRVGRIGTVARYKPKSALDDVARELRVPKWEIDGVKDTITDRSSGDERAAFAVEDALGDTDVGKALVEKYPGMKYAGVLEGHARHTGKHAAGVLVTERPITTFTTVDRNGVTQIDKKDAEKLNMLKIDCLGLRTLSVLEDCLEQIGKTPDWLVEYPLDDTEAFEILNQERYSGIFQFEGYALQALTRQMGIQRFDDIAVITALARPGPLHCGAAHEFVQRRIGEAKPTELHPLLRHVTKDTFGAVIYQEQVMMVCREMGQFTWEDVTMIRRIMSKSFGDEFFARYWEKFKEGAAAQGVPEDVAKDVWDKICTFGSWAFNKSHAVSYGLISYWCCMLKARYPLEFGVACLRNAKDNDQALHILRELVEEDYEYLPVDPKRSGASWEVIEGRLVGGLTNIKGIGPAKARDILERRAAGKQLLPGMVRLLTDPETPFDSVFPVRERFGDYFENPTKYGIESGELSHISDIHDPGEYVFIAKLVERKLRDMNEAHSISQRGGRRMKGSRTRFINLVLEDDTGQIIGKITTDRYPRWGKPIVEEMKDGDYCLFKGNIGKRGWRIVYIKKWRYLEEREAQKDNKVVREVFKESLETTLERHVEYDSRKEEK